MTDRSLSRVTRARRSEPCRTPSTPSCSPVRRQFDARWRGHFFTRRIPTATNHNPPYAAAAPWLAAAPKPCCCFGFCLFFAGPSVPFFNPQNCPSSGADTGCWLHVPRRSIWFFPTASAWLNGARCVSRPERPESTYVPELPTSRVVLDLTPANAHYSSSCCQAGTMGKMAKTAAPFSHAEFDALPYSVQYVLR